MFCLLWHNRRPFHLSIVIFHINTELLVIFCLIYCSKRSSIGNLNHIKYKFGPYQTKHSFVKRSLCGPLFHQFVSNIVGHGVELRPQIYYSVFLPTKLLFYFVIFQLNGQNGRFSWKNCCSNLGSNEFFRTPGANSTRKMEFIKIMSKRKTICSHIEITCLRLLTKRATLLGRWLSFVDNKT